MGLPEREPIWKGIEVVQLLHVWGGAGVGGSGLELELWRVKINQGHSERSRKRRGSGRQTVHQGQPTSVQEELLE